MAMLIEFNRSQLTCETDVQIAGNSVPLVTKDERLFADLHFFPLNLII